MIHSDVILFADSNLFLYHQSCFVLNCIIRMMIQFGWFRVFPRTARQSS